MSIRDIMEAAMREIRARWAVLYLDDDLHEVVDKEDGRRQAFAGSMDECAEYRDALIIRAQLRALHEAGYAVVSVRTPPEAHLVAEELAQYGAHYVVGDIDKVWEPIMGLIQHNQRPEDKP
jgi:hypothetical protein